MIKPGRLLSATTASSANVGLNPQPSKKRKRVEIEEVEVEVKGTKKRRENPLPPDQKASSRTPSAKRETTVQGGTKTRGTAKEEKKTRQSKKKEAAPIKPQPTRTERSKSRNQK